MSGQSVIIVYRVATHSYVYNDVMQDHVTLIAGVNLCGHSVVYNYVH